MKGVKKLIVGAKKSIVMDKPPPLLVGMLFSARRVVHVRTTEALEGAAKLSFGDQLLKRLGLGSGFVASGSGGDNSANTVDLVGTDSVPVAFAPAFVVTSTKQAANGQVKYEIASVNEEVVEEKATMEARAPRSKHRIEKAAHEERPLSVARRAPRMVPEPSPSAGVRGAILGHAL